MLVDPLAHRVAHADRNVDGDVRIRLGKALQYIRQDSLADILRRTDPHHTVHVGQQEAGHRLVIERQKPPGIAEQELALRRQRHRAGVAQEQRAAKHFLELLDLHRNRRRRAVDRLRGGRKVTGLGNGDESLEHVHFEQRKRVAHHHVHGGILDQKN
jgi:hypothetical protein